MIAQQSKRDTKENIVQVSVRFPESIRTKLKIMAAKEGKSLNLLLEEIIFDHIKNYTKKVK
jgi:predicted HicB family RNase H-like nuclease